MYYGIFECMWNNSISVFRAIFDTRMFLQYNIIQKIVYKLSLS